MVGGSGESAFFKLDMHPDLGDPIEQLGMEVEQDDNDTITDFKQRFGVKLLWDAGVNVTALEEEDLRCGGLVIISNMSLHNDLRLSQVSKTDKTDFKFSWQIDFESKKWFQY